MFTQTFTQTEINALLSAKLASITSTTALSLGSITTSGSITANKIITRYFEPPTGSTDLNFNASSTAVMTLTSLLIRLFSPVQIDQGCKIQNNLSLGSYSPSNPTLWIETTAIQNGSITTSNNITAGVNIYATDGLIKGKNLEITSTSTFTGTMTANTINLSSITCNESSGLEKLTIKGASTLEFRDKNNFPLFNVSSNANTGFTIHTHLLMNNWDIVGARNIGAPNDIVGGNVIVAANTFKGEYLEITSTSSFTGYISSKHVHKYTG